MPLSRKNCMYFGRASACIVANCAADLATGMGGSAALRVSSRRSDACARASSRRVIVTSSSHDSGTSSTFFRNHVYCVVPMPDLPVFLGASVRSQPANDSVALAAPAIAVLSALSFGLAVPTNVASVPSASCCSSNVFTAPTHKSLALPLARFTRAWRSNMGIVFNCAVRRRDSSALRARDWSSTVRGHTGYRHKRTAP